MKECADDDVVRRLCQRYWVRTFDIVARAATSASVLRGSVRKAPSLSEPLLMKKFWARARVGRARRDKAQLRARMLGGSGGRPKEVGEEDYVGEKGAGMVTMRWECPLEEEEQAGRGGRLEIRRAPPRKGGNGDDDGEGRRRGKERLAINSKGVEKEGAWEDRSTEPIRGGEKGVEMRKRKTSGFGAVEKMGGGRGSGWRERHGGGGQGRARRKLRSGRKTEGREATW